jgi:hypothetical protein
MPRDDTGFICKACHRFFADSEVKEWETKWEPSQGEDRLVEITHRCPFCGSIQSYIPNEAIFRWQAKSGQ